MIFNYSCRILSEVEKRVLSKGFRYALTYSKTKFVDHFCTFEMFFKKLLHHEFYDVRDKGFDFFRCSLKHLAFSSFYDHSNFIHNMTKDELNALKNLPKDQSIIITKPDKGNGVVLLNKTDYINKVLHILNDTSKFEPILDDVLITILNKEER